MSSKPITVPANSLSLLLGEYNSDSDYEDGQTTKSPGQATEHIIEAVDNFVSELDSVCLPIGATNWTKCMDKNTGHPYYWNTESKEVTWEVPDDYQTYLDQNAALLADARVANMWTVVFTDDSNTSVYYVNEYTRIVSWNKPIGYIERETELKSKPVAAAIEPKPSKNIIKRRKTAKPKRENPFAKEKDAEIEKIELITSFDPKSDSSSDEERQNNASPSTSLKLKLVATDYNSDDNYTSNVNSSPITVDSFPTVTKKTASLKSCSEDIASKKAAKKTNTFASIITGGRSPEHASTDMHLPSGTGVDGVEPPIEETANEPDIATPVKMTRRKRRIEFITKATETPEQENLIPTCAELTKDKSVEVDVKKAVSVYAIFQAGPVEFEKSVANVSELSDVANDANKKSNGTGVTMLKETIEAKLKFLCDGRPEVPAVQAILIQLETLLEAYDEGALQEAYMLKWLEAIGNDLQTLEADAAPPGWKCLWNRSKSQYCYKHLDTGEIQWEYPGGSQAAPAGSDSVDGECGGTGPIERDDAMDICTTPPPNVNEQLVLAAGASKAKCAELHVLGVPDPPKWDVSEKTLEPLPPGTDTINLEKSDVVTTTSSATINMELASFYSDLAAIDSSTPPAEPMSATVVDPRDGIVAADTNKDSVAEEAVKKKKRKIKKLQPWRSGNLETWINKWQKAQQELDN